mmetsp:Transcript_2945/g.3365  ORF Transcript_2945/g.3365 Transcript_2945/m.3365 type:complete len:459 (-) Transcript_2945:131-1507(-)
MESPLSSPRKGSWETPSRASPVELRSPESTGNKSKIMKSHRRNKNAKASPVTSSGSTPVTATMQLLFFARLFAVFVVSVAVNQIGILFYPFLTLLKPYYFRRLSDNLESLWVNACLWCFPTYYLVRHGEFPEENGSSIPTDDHIQRPRRPSISYRNVLHNVFNTRDDEGSVNSPKVIICNHATEADWFYLWMIARMGSVDRTGNVKIMLKDPIKNIPIFGWGCRLFQFIFLKRDWKVDEKTIKTSLKQLCEDREPLWIFLFPEGMTINTRSVEKSKSFAFASERDRPLLEKTLLPRSKGFESVIDLLNEHSEYPPEIFDVTMNFDGYSGEIPTWEMGYTRNVDVLVPTINTFIMGTAASRCHLDSRKFTYSEVKSHPEGVEGWLDEQWVRKERLMLKFAEEQGFPSECGPGEVVLVQGSLWQSLLAVAFNIAVWVCLVFVIQKKTENVSFWEVLPQFV